METEEPTDAQVFVNEMLLSGRVAEAVELGVQRDAPPKGRHFYMFVGESLVRVTEDKP